MKRIIILLCAAVSAFSQGNMLKNPGFETAAGTKPADWLFTEAPGEENAVSLDNAQFRTGKFGAKISHQNTASYSQIRQNIELKPDTDYVASVWVRGENVTLAEKGLGVKLFLGKKDGGTLKASDMYKGTFAWKKISLPFNSGSQTMMTVILYLHQGSGTVWFDDVEVREGKEAPVEAAPSAAKIQPLSGVNLALGKKYTMSKKPSYSLCTDADDEKQLTDGAFTEGYFWTQKSTVGWVNAGRVEIVIDLGAVEPIRELAVSTAGGAKAAAVNFPDAVFFVSEDGKKFYHAGRRFGTLMPDRNGEWYAARYHLNDLRTKGRYVAVSLVANGSYMFADEIEVIKGDFAASAVTLTGTTYTVDMLGTAIFDMRKSARDKAALLSELRPLKDFLSKNDASLADEIAGIEKEAEGAADRAALTALRDKAGSINAKAAAIRFPGTAMIVHAGSGWNDFGAFDIPPEGTDALKTLSIVMGADEYESVSFGVFNAGGSTRSVSIDSTDLVSPAGKIARKNITLRFAENVECNDGLLRPDALPLAVGAVPIAPGNNRAFWVQVKTDNTPAGDYTGTISLSGGKGSYTITLTVKVLPVKLPRPIPVATYNWAYTVFAPVKADEKAAVADLAAHYIDTAVIHPSQMPKFTFDDSGNITASDFAAFDAVLKLHRDAGIKKFWFFCYFGDIGNGINKPLGDFTTGKTFKLGTPEWKTAMKALTVQVVSHCTSLGLSYPDYAMYPIDEPNDKLINNGGREIWAMFKEADPKLRIFVDPTHATSVAAMKTIAPYVDIWCPHLDGALDDARLQFFAEEQRAGKTIIVYNCKGPDKTFHPLGHYRRMLWQIWQYGYTGAGHWDYADTGWTKGENSAWTDFDGARIDFSIIYDAASAPEHVTKKEVQIPSRRWEAWRDGVEEYAYLWLLKESIGKARAEGKEAAAASAEKVLKNTVEVIVAQTKDTGAFAAAHRSILETIAALEK